MRGADVMEPREREEMMKAFAQPAPAGNDLVPVGGGFTPMAEGVSIHDGIITAKKVEVARDDGKILQKISAHAAVAGSDWFYRFPVKKKGGGQDWITGPSIKCANNVARLYGNCQVDVRVQDAGATWIIYARFVDYETGFSYTRPFQQAKNASRMGGQGPEADARRLDIALQIGASKAIRNVICNALETFTNFAFDEAQKNLVGRVGKDLPKYKAKVKERIEELKVDLKRVETALGRAYDKWLAPEVAQLIAELQSINDGMATPDELWPPPAPAAPSRKDFTEAGQAATNGSAPSNEHTPGGDGDGQPAADASAQAAAGDSQPEASGQPGTDKPNPDRWKIDVVGQGPKLDAFFKLLDGECATEQDVDDLRAAHKDFIAKCSAQKQKEVANECEQRKAQIRTAATSKEGE